MANMSNWSNLPNELFDLIMEELASVDIIRFKAVSKSWCLAANSYISSSLYSPFRQSPWLMLPPQRHQNHSSFFNFAENKVYKLNNVLEGFDHEAWCAGSSHGWLVIFDQKGKSFLFNPFSRVTIQLPSIKFLHQLDRQHKLYDDGITSDKILVAKAILMSDPSRTKSFTVVIIYGFLHRLAFYIHGESSAWTCFGDFRFFFNGANSTWTCFGNFELYNDILCHNDQLYVLPNNSDRRCEVFLEVWNFDNNFPEKVTSVVPSNDTIAAGREDRLYPRAYLMESMGKILCVKRFTRDDEEGTAEKISNHFFVQKLDCGGKKLEAVETLGDQAIFLGRNQSIAVSTQKFGEWEKDSIYFLARKEILDVMVEIFGGVHHLVEVYNLGKKTFKPCRETNMIQHIQEYDPTPFWIVPNPW